MVGINEGESRDFFVIYQDNLKNGKSLISGSKPSCEISERKLSVNSATDFLIKQTSAGSVSPGCE